MFVNITVKICDKIPPYDTYLCFLEKKGWTKKPDAGMRNDQKLQKLQKKKIVVIS